MPLTRRLLPWNLAVKLSRWAAAVAAAALVAGSAGAAEHVIHISVDGLQSAGLQALINANETPHFKRFQTEGAWTVNARTDYSHSITLPNHTSMLTGRPVTQPSGMPNTVHHGWLTNVDPPTSATLHNSGNPNVPYKASTFDAAHDAGLSTAHFASKSKFIIYEQSYNATTGADHPNGRDKIDYFAAIEATSAMHADLMSRLASQNFNYTFLHYADPDDAGHSSGWGGTAWQNAVKTIDGYLGQLFNLVTTDPELAGRTAIVLSADHGGTGTAGHSDATLASNYTIPFFAWGAGVASGDLYALNPGARTNPGTSRVTYTAPGQPIRNGDGGNLALSLLGVGPIPGSLINAAQDLRVAKPGDFNADGNVDGGDLANWSGGYGAAALGSHVDGDADGDRDVDGADFLRWQRLAGAPAPATAVPEPSVAALAVLACLGVARRRR